MASKLATLKGTMAEYFLKYKNEKDRSLLLSACIM